MKSKEEVLREEYEKVFSPPKYENSVNKGMNQKYILPAMDQWAKIQGMAFQKWYERSSWSGFCKSNEDLDNRKTLSEIYDIFIQHQSQQNG